jgi:DMSO/TMAO reductase YedYZ molybdopterin-dependent catalytic subunit
MSNHLRVLALVFALSGTLVHAQTPAASSTASSELRVGGAVQTPLTLTAEDLRKMPRKTLWVTDLHSQKHQMYEGVPLETILRKAGAPIGDQLRGAAFAIYVVAESEDKYRVVFSLAELDSGMVNSDIIVADTLDGAPLPDKVGPFRIVAPLEKRPARWVRMLKSITVVRAQ